MGCHSHVQPTTAIRTFKTTQRRLSGTHFSEPRDVTHVVLGIPDGLYEDRLRFIVDGSCEVSRVVGGDELDADAELFECHYGASLVRRMKRRWERTMVHTFELIVGLSTFGQ